MAQLIYAIAASLLHSLYTYLYFKRYAIRLKTSKYAYVFMILFTIIGLIPLYNNINLGSYFYILRAITIFTANFIMLLFIFKTECITKVYIMLNYYIYIFIGFIFYSSILLDMNYISISLDTVNYNNYYELSYLFSYMTVICIALFLGRKKFLSKAFYVIKSKRTLSLLVSIQLIFVGNLMFILKNILFDEYYEWINNIVMINSFSLYVTYLAIYLLVIHVNYLTTYKFSSKMLDRQLQIQIEHYKSYESHLHSILKFKHDYQNLINSLALINKDIDSELIKNVIDETNEELFFINSTYTRYSDNYILDALLNYYVPKLEQLGISSFSDFQLPFKGKLSEYDTIKLFTNIFDNIITALLELNKDQRYLEISTKLIEGYQSIIFKNASLNKYNIYSTTKKDKILHGHGLDIIQEVIDKNIGFLNINFEEVDHNIYFILKITLPTQ